MEENELTEVFEQDGVSEVPSAMLGEELVFGAVGPRGSGKSMFIAYLGLLSMAGGARCYSNFPVGGCIPPGRRGKEIHAMPLDPSDLYGMAKKLSGAMVLLDEVQYLGDARSSMSTGNRLLGYLSMQIRKRGMSMAFSCQDLSWVDRRLQFQCDVLAVCSDASKTAWGREEQPHLRRGELVFVELRDWSGFVTGTPWREKAMPFGTITLNGKLLWSLFDTRNVIEMSQAFTKVEVEKTVYDVSFRPSGDGAAGPVDTKVLNRSSADCEFHRVVDDLRAHNTGFVPAEKFRDFLQERGVPLSSRSVGAKLAQLGVPKTKVSGELYYEF